MPLATYTRGLLAGPPADAPGDGPVCNEVECVFTGFPPDAGLAREVCLALARTVEQGGTAGIQAGKELLIEIRHARSFYEPEWDEDEDEDGDHA